MVKQGALVNDSSIVYHYPLRFRTRSSICFSSFGLVVVPQTLIFSSASFFISISTALICLPEEMR